jgi:hypothetical protein
MRRFCTTLAIVASLSSAAMAQPAKCRTDDPGCRGYATFGPAAAARCISIRGAATTNFCQNVGDKQRVFIQAGDRYCAVLGSTPVPEPCDAHWITVTEPQ